MIAGLCQRSGQGSLSECWADECNIIKLATEGDVFPVIPLQNNVIFWRNDRKYLCCSQATSVLVHKELHHPPVSRFYNESIEQNIAEVHA